MRSSDYMAGLRGRRLRRMVSRARRLEEGRARASCSIVSARTPEQSKGTERGEERRGEKKSCTDNTPHITQYYTDLDGGHLQAATLVARHKSTGRHRQDVAPKSAVEA